MIVIYGTPVGTGADYENTDIQLIMAIHVNAYRDNSYVVQIFKCHATSKSVSLWQKYTDKDYFHFRITIQISLLFNMLFQDKAFST